MMYGYHYTTFKAWTKIRTEGLKPYPLKNGLSEHSDAGIWVWQERKKDADHVGSALFPLTKTGETRLVLLKVQFHQSSIMRERGNGASLVQVVHDGTIGDWEYHKRSKAWVLVDPIPPERIKLLGDWDLEYLLKIKD